MLNNVKRLKSSKSYIDFCKQVITLQSEVFPTGFFSSSLFLSCWSFSHTKSIFLSMQFLCDLRLRSSFEWTRKGKLFSDYLAFLMKALKFCILILQYDKSIQKSVSLHSITTLYLYCAISSRFVHYFLPFCGHY